MPVIAVNAAAKEVKAVALFSQHPERFMARSFEWAKYQKVRFGQDFTVHSRGEPQDMPWVDHWWLDCMGGGSSAWGARKLAWLIGFDPVVLCGCPLEPMPYVNYGLPVLMSEQRIHDEFRAHIESQPEWWEGVHSMSGWTREKFGEPT